MIIDWKGRTSDQHGCRVTITANRYGTCLGGKTKKFEYFPQISGALYGWITFTGVDELKARNSSMACFFNGLDLAIVK